MRLEDLHYVRRRSAKNGLPSAHDNRSLNQRRVACQRANDVGIGARGVIEPSPFELWFLAADQFAWGNTEKANELA